MVVQSLPGCVWAGCPSGNLWSRAKRKKKKGNTGITIPPWRFWFLIFFSFCLPTVQLHFTPILNFKQSTHAQKKSVFILFLSIIYMLAPLAGVPASKYSELALPRTDDLRTRRLKNPLVIRTCQARFLANKNVAYFSTAR